MTKILVAYFSQTGNTQKMAKAVSEGAEQAGAEVDVLNVQQIEDLNSLTNYDGIIMGSPTYYGIMANQVKEFLDKSIKVHGKLEGKVGGAFASCGIDGGGSESTVLSIIQALLVHGMIVPGFSKIGHYGPVTTGEPDDRAISECKQLGERVANLADKVS
ncbi:flavodoxin family protein [Natranaerobius thermophilus]|uniref:Flavodoxin/nitric oxide synthase n=1 Tax=Natranaerobius thermophilus (strain ATCC BAA-1301 / DSM 18059 / JW/NM-WN-LF) TaxID=457570 RepID=B2A899_NATTJ|nr:NAD(P)H-dependent oxidoreductase [Natranaerobius thermophilus]ACB84465.1 flavodoxin/nitric oxide synthase [Natranaerobius thermophilus JW/NM-WN-LF]